MISESTIEALREFNRERDWDRYNTPESLAKSISIEAAELLECYQWAPDVEHPDVEHAKDELADVLTYCIKMAEALGCDMDEIILNKMAKTAVKYPAKIVKDDFEEYRAIHDSK